MYVVCKVLELVSFKFRLFIVFADVRSRFFGVGRSGFTSLRGVGDEGFEVVELGDDVSRLDDGVEFALSGVQNCQLGSCFLT